MRARWLQRRRDRRVVRFFESGGAGGVPVVSLIRLGQQTWGPTFGEDMLAEYKAAKERLGQ